jgi:putative two-component system response regulator
MDFTHRFSLGSQNDIIWGVGYGAPLTLGLVGIDSFKKFNEKSGRLEGDRLLKNVAGAILKSVRKADLASRFMGDIFSILFTESNTENSLQAIERIRTAVKDLPGNPSVSFGLAAYSPELSNAEQLFLEAEEALNKSKIRGKDKVSIYQRPTVRNIEYQPKVLIVDDEPKNLKLLQAMLTHLNYDVVLADNGNEALAKIDRVDIDLVLLDVMMPELDGFETCRHIKNNPKTQMIPVVLVTALDDMNSKIKGIESGADDFLTKPVNRIELIARTQSLIRLKMLHNNLTDIENVLFSFAKAVEAKDEYTQGHTERVATLSTELGKRMGLPEHELKALSFGGALHDIGKIGIPNQILNKPDHLSNEEWAVMKSHASIGYDIGFPLKKNLDLALKVILYHHEKMDGSGYPDGLKGEEIPLVARIVGIADIFDALTTDRPYRKAMTKEKALDIISEEAGSGKLDKKIVGTLIDSVINSGETLI